MRKVWVLVGVLVGLGVGFGAGWWARGWQPQPPPSPPAPAAKQQSEETVESLSGRVVAYDGTTVTVKLDDGQTATGAAAQFEVWSLEASPGAKPKQAGWGLVKPTVKVTAAVDKNTGRLVGLLVLGED